MKKNKQMDRWVPNQQPCVSCQSPASAGLGSTGDSLSHSGHVGNTRRRRLITCCQSWPAARRFWLGLHLISKWLLFRVLSFCPLPLHQLIRSCAGCGPLVVFAYLLESQFRVVNFFHKFIRVGWFHIWAFRVLFEFLKEPNYHKDAELKCKYHKVFSFIATETGCCGKCGKSISRTERNFTERIWKQILFCLTLSQTRSTQGVWLCHSPRTVSKTL